MSIFKTALPVVGMAAALTLAQVTSGAAAFAAPVVAVVTDARGFVHDVVKPTDGDSTVVQVLREVVQEEQGGEMRHLPTADQLQYDGLDVVVFYTTGEVPLDVPALQAWIEAGGGFVGLHCATDTLMNNEQFVSLIGGAFKEHPWNAGDEVVLDRLDDHPTVAMIDDGHTMKEEIYVLKQNPTNVDVHLRLDTEKTQKKVDGVDDVPITWTKDVGKGRVVYSSLGHNESVWRSAMYRQHLSALISYAGQDRASNGAQSDAETDRGRNPWVFRCTLDGRARVVVLALGQDLWAAYDATSCGLYKVWTGDIDLTGSVYDTRHGPQPQSVGDVLDQFGENQEWQRVDADGNATDIIPTWRGYDMDGTKSVQFHYTVEGDNGAAVKITETVDVAGPRTMKRTFDVTEGTAVGLRVMLANGEAEVVAEGGEHISEERGQGAVHFLQLPESGEATVTVTWPEAPEVDASKESNQVEEENQ